MNRTLVMGDPHGGYKAVKQVLKRAKFDYEKDTLIILGDVADGWPDTARLVEFLLTKVKNLKTIRGNHDDWVVRWMYTREMPYVWVTQGGRATIKSYSNITRFKKHGEKESDVLTRHRRFFSSMIYYFVDDHDRLFVHGGINPNFGIEYQDVKELMWSRYFWLIRDTKISVSPYKEIYVGHTSIWSEHDKPAMYNNVWFMDTGGGFEGKLSLMDIDTKEIWQSDMVMDLYKQNNS